MCRSVTVTAQHLDVQCFWGRTGNVCDETWTPALGRMGHRWNKNKTIIEQLVGALNSRCPWLNSQITKVVKHEKFFESLGITERVVLIHCYNLKLLYHIYHIINHKDVWVEPGWVFSPQSGRLVGRLGWSCFYEDCGSLPDWLYLVQHFRSNSLTLLKTL